MNLAIIEALIFLGGDKITKKEIMSAMNISSEEFDEIVTALKKKYCGGIILKEFGDKLCFATSPKVEAQVTEILNPVKEREFTSAVMEVLSIIAYKQPITRLEIEKIRGTSSDYSISNLLKNDIITVVGRKDAIGRPQLFGTTDNFLRKFNLKSLNCLPEYEVMLEEIEKMKQERTNTDTFFGFEADKAENEEFDNEELGSELLDGEEIDESKPSLLI